jgi:hypothetical protein
MRFRVVQPWGRYVASQSTEISRHESATAAFAYIDDLAHRMLAQRVPSDAIELRVIDEWGQLVTRRNAH